MKITDRLSEIGIIPVINLKQTELAPKLARALDAGGIPAAEVTFRSKGAARAIRAMKMENPGLLVGAGTVLSTEQAEKAVRAGAEFIATPGLNAEVVNYCRDRKIPIFPGCVTPTEIEAALRLGLAALKFFPAQQFGGIKTINALAAPYQDVRFMPTGGIGLDNLEEYLTSSRVFACGGSFMVSPQLLEKENWSEVERLARAAAAIVKRVRKEG